MDDREKWPMYNKHCRDFFTADRHRQPVKIPITDINNSSTHDDYTELDERDKDNQFKDILDAIPMKFCSKAGLLLKKLKSDGKVV